MRKSDTGFCIHMMSEEYKTLETPTIIRVILIKSTTSEYFSFGNLWHVKYKVKLQLQHC